MTDGGAGRFLLNDAWVIGIAIHHSVSGGSFFMSNAPTLGDELSHLEMIDRYHASKGWGGFGYHLAAFLSGRLYLCGNLNGARAHVASRNNQLVGLVLIGTFTTVLPPASQLAGAAAGVAYIRRTYPGRPIGPHRNWALLSEPTSCPGDTWANWVPTLDAPPQEEDTMKLIRAQPSGRVFVIGESGRRYIDDIPEWEAYQAAGYGLVDIPDGWADNIPDAPKRGGLIRAQPSGRVFVIGEGGRRYINDVPEVEAYQAAGYGHIDIPDAKADSIPDVGS
jgi:hypothetical protein